MLNIVLGKPVDRSKRKYHHYNFETPNNNREKHTAHGYDWQQDWWSKPTVLIIVLFQADKINVIFEKEKIRWRSRREQRPRYDIRSQSIILYTIKSYKTLLLWLHNIHCWHNMVHTYIKTIKKFNLLNSSLRQNTGHPISTISSRRRCQSLFIIVATSFLKVHEYGPIIYTYYYCYALI